MSELNSLPSRPSDFIPALLKSNLCSGCGLCEALAKQDGIEVTLNNEGLYRPSPCQKISDSSGQLLTKLCPGLSVPVRTKDQHPAWGPMQKLVTAFSTNEELRFVASSGGALSEILSHLIESGQIDGVLQVKADDSNPLMNMNIVSKSFTDIKESAGSRYCPSAPLRNVLDNLETEKRFAIVGKPCDIAAIRKYEKIEPAIAKHYPILISFFCGGIPSLRGAQSLLKTLKVDEKQLKSFRFRGYGWPGKATAIDNNDEESTMSYSESWGRILNKHLQLRCKICPDSTGEQADIVCADAWHLDSNNSPDFAEHPGRSVVMARTVKGENVINAAIKSNRLSSNPLLVEELNQMQPYQAKRKQLVYSRILAMKIFARPTPNYNAKDLRDLAKMASASENLKSFLGMFKRLLLKLL